MILSQHWFWSIMILSQHFYNKSYAKSCLLMGKKVILVLGSNYNHNNLPHWICCEIIVNVAILLFLLNPNFCNSQVRMFNIFIRVITINQFNIYIYIYIASVYIHFFLQVRVILWPSWLACGATIDYKL